MSLSASKPTLSRLPSSPSLAVGLPPALPESNIMAPSSKTPTKMSKSKSKKKVHRGDVESTPSSSDVEDASLATGEIPKRKVVNTVQPTPTPSKKGKKRETLAERLASAAAGNAKAKIKSSSSVHGGLKESSSASALSSTAGSSSAAFQTPPSQARTSLVPSTMPVQRTAGRPSGANSADKVVVCVRIKPSQNPFASVAYDVTPTSLTLSDNHPKVKQRGGKAGREDTYTYTFDKLLQHPSVTPELYSDKVAPLVDKAMNGFNSTVFAYGQTGSGKSFTMTGVASELGIIPCAVDGVFDAITSDPERAFLLRVSYIEIYNETLRDLLNFKKTALRDDEKPAIHTSKGKVYVEPLVEEIVSTPEDVMELLEKGNAQRRIGATDWNERSSRSHCVFTIVIESKPRDGDGSEDIRLSRLNLIDLAGSEKAVSDSERRGEGKHINQSLLALREVINKLTEKNKASHIPYRNSKLTHLLENALGGDSNICVICTLSADEEHCGETLETLKFAGRCSQVKTNAKKNILPSSELALIRAKDQEIEELRARLLGITDDQRLPRSEIDNDQILDLAESVAAMEARKSKLTAQLAKLNSEILTSELPRHPSGSLLPMSPPKPKRRRISDFSAMVSTGADRMGLGMGTPKKNDRRAVSGLARVQEEGDMMGIMGTMEAVSDNVVPNFEHDIALAALKKSLAHKEEEIALANRNLATALARASQLSQRDERIASLTAELSVALKSLSELQTTLQSTDSHLRDKTAQLETTQADLVTTIEDKSLKIDELEIKVLELRKSREELALEDEGRLQEVTKQLEKMVFEKEELAERMIDLENGAKAREKAEKREMAIKQELERVKAELEDAQKQHSDTLSSADAAKSRLADSESSVSSLTSQINNLLKSQTSREAELEALKVDYASVQTKRDQATADLDSFQREAMANETQVLAELRQEIGNLRKLREDDQAAWDTQKVELEANLDSVKEREAKVEAQMKDALQTLQDAARANKGLQEKLSKEMEEKRNLEAERDGALQKVEETAGGSKVQLEQEITARQQLQAQLASLRSEFEVQKVSAEATMRELEIGRETAKHATERLESLQREMETQETRIEKVVDERKEVEARLSELETALEQGEKEWKGRVEDEEAKRNAVERKLKNLEMIKEAGTSAEKELQARLQSATQEKEDLEKKMKEAEERHLATKDSEAALKNKLDSEVAERRISEAKLVKLESLRETGAELRRELDLQANSKLEAEKKLSELLKLQDSRIIAEAELQKKLEVEATARRVVEKKLVELGRQRELTSSSEAELREKLTREIQAKENAVKMSADLEEKLRDQDASLRAQVGAQETARAEVEKKLAELLKQGETKALSEGDLQKRLDAEITARAKADKRLSEISQQLTSAGTTGVQLQSRLDKETRSRKEAEERLNKFMTSSASESQKVKALQTQLTKYEATVQQLSTLKAEHVSLQERLGQERARYDAKITELQLAAKHNKALEATAKEMTSLRDALKQAQSEAKIAKEEADTHKEKTAKLANDLVALEAQSKDKISSSTSVSTRLRTLSTPGPWARDGEMDGSVKGLKTRALKGTTNGMGAGERDSSMATLRAKDEDLVERLEKVVEVQKSIIDEQRTKIERWAKEMEKQREIVRLLTNDSQSTVYTPSPRRVSGHSKAHSISHSPTHDNAAAVACAKAFPSTFTARNLALPTTPTPLPMHSSQFSNSSVKIGRRRTIEHDIDLLTESSKVNMAKAIFESPDKNSKAFPATPTREPLRANQANWSIPRQRRP